MTGSAARAAFGSGDSQPLSDDERRLRPVVADDNRPARWIRQISGFTLMRVAP